MSDSQEVGFMPPSDIKAERSVLCSVLLGFGECLELVTPILQDEDFYLEVHQVLFKAMKLVAERGEPISIDTLHVQLCKMETDRGGDDWIHLMSQVMDTVPHDGHAEFHANQVRAVSIRRRAIYAAMDITRLANNANAETDELLQLIDSQLGKLSESSTKKAGKTFRSLALTAMDRLASPREEGLKLGYMELDDMLGGAKPGQVIVIAARPGMGKSAFALNICRRVARYQGVLFCSIEMPEDELLDRAIVSDMKVSLSELRPLARNDESREQVLESLHTLSVLPVTIDDSPDQTIATIGQQARLARRTHGLGLIIVDYLQIIRSDSPKESREQQVAAISWGLKRLAKQLHVPVIGLAQLNREIEKRPDKTPRLSDLRESGAIEQNANVVILLDRPGQYDDNHEPHEAVAIVAKNRGGRTGKIDLHWDGPSATFREPESLAAGFGANDCEMPGDNDFI